MHPAIPSQFHLLLLNLNVIISGPPSAQVHANEGQIISFVTKVVCSQNELVEAPQVASQCPLYSKTQSQL
jgi:hypothetical protein